MRIDSYRARRVWRRILDPAPGGAGAPADGRRVCLLAWHFPPEVTGGTYRPAALSRYGTEAGLQFTVFTAAFPGDPSPAGRYLVERLPGDVRVIRVPESELRLHSDALPPLDGGALQALETWRAATREFMDVRPGVVYATGPPFHTFVAGRALASRFDVPLILEYRDEWTECPFDFVEAGPADRRWEERCLAAAARVIFTTRSQLEHHVRVFPILERERCVVIPNGWEPEDGTAGAGPEERAAGTKCTIVFAGNLGDHTPPDDFLECLRRAVEAEPDLRERFRFLFVGQKSPRTAASIERFSISSLVEAKAQVPKSAARGILEASGGLLLLNPRALARYVPGKLYEYLAADRPVLVYGEGGEVGELVRRLEAGPVVRSGDARELASALNQIPGWRPSPAAQTSRRAWLERHTRRALALQTVDLLRELRASTSDTAASTS